MTHHDHARPRRRRPPVLVVVAPVALVALIGLGPASAPLAAHRVPGPWTAAAGAEVHPVTVTVDAVASGQHVGWQDAVRLVSPPLSTPRVGAGYRLPVPDAVIRATFDAPAAQWARGHRGVDLEAGAGAQVLAPAGGVVRFVGTVVDRGVVTVEHADGLRSSLEPVLGQVEVGTRVPAGQPIGTVQDVGSHCRAVVCVHWGVRRGAAYLDPLSLLPGSGPVVLLPVPGG